ncbi:MAG TPA: galactose oxidase-like domain-containing protein [Pyrinomonadaceae bacterium]|nr:galactose oxidase-like domain-containing protein [Pyrinomonadaceae bacterium]
MSQVSRSAPAQLAFQVCLITCLLLLVVSLLSVAPLTTRAATAAAVLQTDSSVVGQWSAPATWPIVAIHTHVLPNGKVMAWQSNGAQLSTQTYLWDPSNGSFTSVLNPNTHMFCSGHALLPDGRLFVLGGHHFDNGVGEPHTNVFDANTNSWARLADMNAGRWYPTATALGNGEMLVVSGNYWDGTLNPNGTRHIVNNSIPQVWQTTGGWRSLNNANFRLSLYPWMLFAPDGTVFNAGPDQFTQSLDTKGLGAWRTGPTSNFGYRDSGSCVMYDDGKVLIAGGSQPPTNTAEVIDLNAPSPAWRYVAPMAFSRRHLNATLLPDGKVLVTGGTSGGDFNNAVGSVLPAEMWDPATETWSTMASMQVRRLYHSTAVLLPDGRVLSAGGGMPAATGGDDNHFDAEIYSPPYLFKGSRPTTTFAPSTVNYGQPFYVATPNAASIAKVTLVRLSSVTHAFNQNQRINRLRFRLSAGGLLVDAPANGNVCPPGHYMLFILNGNGVPSVARIIKVQSIEPESGVRVARNADGRLDVFYRGADNALYHQRQTSAGSNTWSLPFNLGGVLTSNPVVIANRDGRLEAFARGTDNSLYHRRQNAANGDAWSGWSSLGGILSSDPAVVINADGRLEAFVRGIDNHLYHNWQTAPGSSTWSGWVSLGGSLASAPVVIANSDGRLEVFVRGADNSLQHIAQTTPGSNNWTAWSSLGGILTSGPAVERNLDGRLELFVRGTDNGLHHNRQTSPGSSTWTGWVGLGGVITSAPFVKSNADGRLEVFARGTDNALHHNLQTSAGSSTWTGWSGLEGVLTSGPVAERNSDGRVAVIVRGTDNALYYKRQTSPGSSTWSEWLRLGGSVFSL